VSRQANLRDYVPSDYVAVRLLLEEGGLFEQDWDREERLRTKVERYPGSIIVAEQDRHIVGVVYFIEDGWGAFLFRLAVKDDYRQKGIGSRLLHEAEDRLRRMGVTVVTIFVEEADMSLRGYYEKRGYITSKAYRSMDKIL
jgi:ribosomal protein S18 acetylase RimI-like enzyme